jgi:alpha-tubulin suppressor-like RCC1 family protein
VTGRGAPSGVLIALVLASACRAGSGSKATGIVFELSSDLRVGATRDVDHLTTLVQVNGAAVETPSIIRLTENPFGSRFGVERGPEGPETVDVTFSLGNACDEQVVTRRLTIRFVANDVIHVPVALNTVCAKAACEGNKTCVPGWGCVGPEVDRTGTPLVPPVGELCGCGSFFPTCVGAAWRLRVCPPLSTKCEDKVWRISDFGKLGNGADAHTESALGIADVAGWTIISVSPSKIAKRFLLRDGSRLLWQKDENFDIAWRRTSVDYYRPPKLRLDDGASLPSEPWEEIYTVSSWSVKSEQTPIQLTDSWTVVAPPPEAPTRFGELRCLGRSTDPSFGEAPWTTYCFARDVGKVYEVSDYGTEQLVGATIPVPPSCRNPGVADFPPAESGPSDPQPVTPDPVNPPGSGASMTCAAREEGSKDLDTSVVCGMRVLMVDAGRAHVCAIMAHGQIACWGSDTWGESTPPSGTFTYITAGDDHNCAIDDKGSVKCWGDWAGGKTSPPRGAFVEVSAGRDHTCGIRTDGTVACWGHEAFEQTLAPEGVFVHVSVFGNHACALDEGGRATCWGQNSLQENVVPGGLLFKEISAGGDHSCGILLDGTVRCWGENLSPTELKPPTGLFSHIAAGGDHTCGIRSTGEVECWGEDDKGEVSTSPVGAFASVTAGRSQSCAIRTNGLLACWGSLPGTKVADPIVFTDVSVGSDQTCRLAEDGRANCWGENTNGETLVPQGARFKRITAGAAHGCGILMDDSVLCWGKGDMGQLVPPRGQFVELSAGDEHSCALQSDGQIKCWGQNVNGEAVDQTGVFRGVTVGVSHSCAIRSSDGKVQCWGEDNDGEVSATPPDSFIQIDAGKNFTCGLRADHTIGCWGESSFGKNKPPTGTFVAVAAGTENACALDSKGEVTCWGHPTFNTVNPLASLRPPAGPFKRISVGKDHACGVTPTGEVKCWGDEQAVPPSVPLDCSHL